MWKLYKMYKMQKTREMAGTNMAKQKWRDFIS